MLDTIYLVLRETYWERLHRNAEQCHKFDRLSPNIREEIQSNHDNHHRFVAELLKCCSEIGLQLHCIESVNLGAVAHGYGHTGHRPLGHDGHMGRSKPPSQRSTQTPDLVISCGGDGTFLSCAQHFPDALLLGMNSDYRHNARGQGSYGALTSVNHLNVRKALTCLAQGEYSTSEWQRLGVRLNGEHIKRFAVNDIFFGSAASYLMSDISAELNPQLSETFRCSGFLACTGMGSHAWFAAAGGSPFSNELQAFGYMALWPSHKRPLRFVSGVLSDDHQLTLRPNRDHYILAFDSQNNTIPTVSGDEIQIFLAKDFPVRVVQFALDE